MTDLGTLPGGTGYRLDDDGLAYGVSGDGSIVVGFASNNSGHTAFIWDEINGMQNLAEVLVDEYGIDIDGWVLKSASDISDDGLTIVGYGINPDGQEEGWIVDLSGIPAKPTLVSPVGGIEDISPVFTWNPTFHTDWYRVQVRDSNAELIESVWLDAGNCTQNVCSYDNATMALQAGEYAWDVLAWNAAGQTLSDEAGFTVETITLTKPELSSPQGEIDTATPTFQWKELLGAEWYQLAVDGQTPVWYQAGDICAAGVCSVDFSVALSGTISWTVQGYSESFGLGPVSDAMTFSVPNLEPLKLALSGPQGVVNDATPTISFAQDPNAEWYLVWINGPDSQKAYVEWVEVATVTCENGQCAHECPVELKKGAHAFWMRSYVDGTVGPWSDKMTFTVQTAGAEPIKLTAIAPINEQAGPRPSFVFTEDPAGEWYHLQVVGSDGALAVNQWFSAADDASCADGQCAIASPVELKAGTSKWLVRSYAGETIGPWSDMQTFTVVDTALLKPELVAPTAAVTGETPVFSWKSDPNAQWYLLWVNTAGGSKVIVEWFEAGALNVVNGNFELPSPQTLPAGGYKWWVRSWADDAFSDFSAAARFTVK